MKRKIVQHGPSTLTISLPAQWVRSHGIEKGDEINIEKVNQGLFLTTEKGLQFQTKRISVKGMNVVIPRVIAALYKRGYDEIIVEYNDSSELEAIHEILSSGCIGFEAVEETKGEVRIRKVSEPSQEEFKALFRRLFYFLMSVASEGLEAATKHDKMGYDKIIMRDQHINKISDFCRRVVNKRGQNDYKSDPALYHIIEQLEKIGDNYRKINVYLSKRKRQPTQKFLSAYRKANMLMKDFDSLFFRFSIKRMEEFLVECRKFLKETSSSEKMRQEDAYLMYLPTAIVTELYNLTGATMVLQL